MKHTVSLTANHLFRRLYAKGRTMAGSTLAVYCRRNHLGVNRLGITVSTKVGNAVVRNRVRRRIRESYRLSEHRFSKGYDLVIVARGRSAGARYAVLERELLRLSRSLGVLSP